MDYHEKVVVVGAGVIGITSALAIKLEFPKLEVTIIAEKYSPDTTGDGSAGLWDPYLVQDTPDTDILRWGGATHQWMENFWRTGMSTETGISLVPVIRVTSDVHAEKPSWMSLTYASKKIPDEILQSFKRSYGKLYESGFSFLSYTCEPKYLLPYLMKEFRLLGGIMRTGKINTLDELTEEGFEIVINCTGLGARKFVNDLTVKPIRGQVARLKAPWTFNVFLDDDHGGNYIIPNMESVIVGGTSQENDYDVKVRPSDSKFIRQGCEKITPALENTELWSEWVGLRPGRKTIRLESENMKNRYGKNFTVIHNYGHGGGGVTLCWGCALDVTKLLKNFITRKVQLVSHL